VRGKDKVSNWGRKCRGGKGEKAFPLSCRTTQEKKKGRGEKRVSIGLPYLSSGRERKGGKEKRWENRKGKKKGKNELH